MIKITQGIPQKIPGESSLFVEFKYNPDVIEKIKLLQSYHYDAKTKIWEISLNHLSEFLDSVSLVDDIELVVMKDEPQKSFDGELPEFKTPPFEYQLDGIRYGLSHDRWLLLDAPGLGKTLQLIYIAQERKKRENLEHCLIVCGVNTLKNNWKREIQKHSDMSCRILGEKTSKSGKVTIGSIQDRVDQLKNKIDEFFVITNIETLRDERIIKEINSEKHNKFDMIVVDEIHQCKNPQSQQGKNLLKLTKAPYRIGLTGTVFTNSPTDCYVPLKWIGAEHANYSTFKYFYCIFGGQFNHDLLGYRNTNVLKSQLEHNSLRRTKDILDLPPKTVVEEYIEMNPAQHTFYSNIKRGIVEQADKVELDTQMILSMLIRLRQATACPQILTSENIVSSKIERCTDLVEQILENGQKVVIFNTFKETANTLYNQLKPYGAVLCTGDVKDQEISDNIHRFQTDPKCKVFIGTWQKCGTGITLTAATYMIFIDTPWTPATYTQAQDRIHRVGTKENVTIYNLICSDTVDERVRDIVNDKEMVGDYFVDGKISPKTYEKLKSIIMELK